MHKLLPLILPLFGLIGCGDPSTLLLIETQGRPATAQSLRLAITLEGKRVAVEEPLSESLDDFGLLLPPAASGTLLIEADGLNTAGCIIAQGRTDTILTGRPRVRLRLEMSTLTMPICTKP